MNIVRVMGGLGNQMFQYALGRVMKFKGGIVHYDTSWFSKVKKEERPYCLDYFNTDIAQVCFLAQPIKNEHRYDPEILNLKNYNFNGYWQYLDYYKDYIGLLRDELVVKSINCSIDYIRKYNKIKEKESIGVHVRRGDYLLDKKWPVMTVKYYKNALDIIGSSDKPVYFFTDDYEFCKKHFGNIGTIMQNHAVFDFELLKNCSHQVISASTFSWWAAMLNDNPNKKVVCPPRFIVRPPDAKEYDNRIHFPEEWIKL